MATDRPRLFLASGSAIRRQLLAGAGLAFTADPADIDERAADAANAHLPVCERARRLAEAKAAHVSLRHPRALVIGADQMLEIDGEVLTKAPNAEVARQALLRLRGKTHFLHSGIALARDGEVLWSAAPSAALTVRDFTDTWLAGYVAAAGDALTTSVGAYQLEGLGVTLFERIEGDYFTILGLPLLPLLAELRRRGAVDD